MASRPIADDGSFRRTFLAMVLALITCDILLIWTLFSLPLPFPLGR